RTTRICATPRSRRQGGWGMIGIGQGVTLPRGAYWLLIQDSTNMLMYHPRVVAYTIKGTYGYEMGLDHGPFWASHHVPFRPIITITRQNSAAGINARDDPRAPGTGASTRHTGDAGRSDTARTRPRSAPPRPYRRAAKCEQATARGGGPALPS